MSMVEKVDALAGFRRSAEAEVDGRRRISLGKIGVPEHTRYEIFENDMGEILLVPLVSIPARELIVWQDSSVRASLARGLDQAAAGKLVQRESYAEYAEDDD